MSVYGAETGDNEYISILVFRDNEIVYYASAPAVEEPVEFSFTLYAVWKAQQPSPPTGDGNVWMMIMMISSALCAWYLSDKVKKAKI